MIARARERWQASLDHPILRLELRRIRRKRWWPGRRFFLFYPVLLGGALGCGVAVALSTLLEELSLPVSGRSIQLAAVVTGMPVVCLGGAASSLLAFALSWIAPALTAATIARERELGTLDLLRVTLLTERSIVLGKLGGCLARLWPGILTLVLLTPFRLIAVTGSGLLGSPFPSLAMLVDSVPGGEWPWGGVLLTSLAGLFKPWSDLALHAAVGLLVSTLVRSSGMAVAVSYGTIIAMRVVLYLGTSLLNVVLLIVPAVMVSRPATALGEMMMNGVLVISALTSLGVVLVELVGATLLVWGAIWCLRQM